MKIGFQKEYLLSSGFTANFWAIGSRTFIFNESDPTDLFGLKPFKTDLILYKDINAFMNNMSTGIKQVVYTTYLISDLLGNVNLIDKLFVDIKNNTENDYFNDAEIIEIPD